MASRFRLLINSFLMVCIFYLIVFISLQVYLADSGNFIFEYSKFGKLLTSDRHTAENQTYGTILAVIGFISPIISLEY